MIGVDVYAKIRRLYFAEHWKIGTIAENLRLHPDTISSAISRESFGKNKPVDRISLLSPYTLFIEETLREYPRLRATRLYEMLKARGYQGSVSQVRRYVAKRRPTKPAEAYLRLRSLPGEQAQVDWAHFGKIKIGRAERNLSCFVCVLSYSRYLYAEFVLDQKIDTLLRCHQMAFERFSGVPREILYDNMKTVVVEREGSHIRFNEDLLDFASYYHFLPKPCAPYRGNEKGKVERTIHYLRHSFFAARKVETLERINSELTDWIERVAHQRPVPGSPDKELVSEAFSKEKSLLVSLPPKGYDSEQVLTVFAKKQPYVRFDGNDYSVPHHHVGQPLTLLASSRRIRIFAEGNKLIATHQRSYSKMEVIESVEHIEALAKEKKRARDLRGRNRLRTHCENIDEFYQGLCEKGDSLSHATSQLNRLLMEYGVPALNEALQEAIQKRAFGVASVNHILEKKRRATKTLPPIAVSLPNHPLVAEVQVKPHALEQYDRLTLEEETQNDA